MVGYPIRCSRGNNRTDELIHYVPQEKEKKIDKSVVSEIIYKLEKSERPVVFVGNGVRLAGAHDKFLKLIVKNEYPSCHWHE